MVIVAVTLFIIGIAGAALSAYVILSLYETIVELRERIAVLNTFFDAKIPPDPQYLAESLKAAAWPTPRENALAEVKEMHALEFGD